MKNKRIAPRAISAELTQQVSQGNGVPSRDNRVGFPNKKVPNISVAGGETGKAPSIRAVGEEFHSKFLGRMI